MHPLDGWYPGYGEVEKIRRMSPFVQGFISSAVRENPAFLESYLLPALDSYDPESEILEDIHKAVCGILYEDAGLGSYEFGSSWLRNVPETLGETPIKVVDKYSTLRKERQRIVAEAKKKAAAELAAVKQRAAAELAEAKRSGDRERIAREKREYRQEVSQEKKEYKQDIAEAKKAYTAAKVSKEEKKALLDQLGKAKRGTHWAFYRDTRTGELVATQAKTMKSGNIFAKAGRGASKISKKYGNVIISAAGVALAPFTGGASLVVAGLVTAANQARVNRIKANKAKREAKKEAASMVAEANQQQAQAGQQMDQFYAQNQKWFVENLDLTPDKWAQLTFDQKLDILQNGMRGTVPGNAPPPQPGDPGTPVAGGGYGTSAGGGGGNFIQPESAPGAPGVATAGMFDGSMLPLLAGGIALALIFGKPAKRSGRARRNPSRRYRARRMRRSA